MANPTALLGTAITAYSMMMMPAPVPVTTVASADFVGDDRRANNADNNPRRQSATMMARFSRLRGGKTKTQRHSERHNDLHDRFRNYCHQPVSPVVGHDFFP